MRSRYQLHRPSPLARDARCYWILINTRLDNKDTFVSYPYGAHDYITHEDPKRQNLERRRQLELARQVELDRCEVEIFRELVEHTSKLQEGSFKLNAGLLVCHTPLSVHVHFCFPLYS